MKFIRSLSIFIFLALVFNLGFSSSVAQVPQAVEPQAAADKIESNLLSKFDVEGSSDFIVRFTTQADLGPAESMDWEARGEFVVQALTEAAKVQERAKAYLDEHGLQHETFIAGNDLYVFQGVAADAYALAELAEVGSLRAPRTYFITPVGFSLQSYDVPENQPDALAWGISYVKADQFWAGFGVQGDNMVVANIDTGVQWDHPALDQAFKCPGDPGNPACWEDPSNICPGGTACDNNGHGTHTMGTMVGDDDPSLTWQAGMAPNSQWIACKGCESTSCSDFALNTCADWILQPGGSPANRPNVVNNSWGGGGGDTWYLAKVQAWSAAGIFPAFSAGNSGPGCSTLGSPGDYQESFSSAAIDSGGTVASFSSRGPSVFGHEPYTKPNISAPGVSVCSSVPGNGWSCAYSGTSMASPHTAGAVSLLWSCNPDLVGQIDLTMQALQNTTNPTPAGNCGAPPDGEGNYTYGYGYLDVLNAGLSYCGDVDLGTLSGHVYDDYGNPVEGANVSAAPAGMSNVINAITDPDGYYEMNLVVGTYDVTASKANYTSQTAFGVEILADQTTTQDFVISFLGSWMPGPPMCFDLTRIDAEFYPATGKVYILGGRYDTQTFGNIYEFDPVDESCVDTGAVMPAPISNYTINLVNDGTDDVLCTFGGRGAAGNSILNVQCYNPITNVATSVANLPSAYTNYTPGGQAVVDNMVYVFGGFNPNAAPYELSRTDRFDPLTNTFTQVGNLSLGRAYLDVAVVDGKIYAFGGTVFDGVNLNAQVRTEVMADPGGAGTWDNAAVAELPAASAEGRAFGFDSDSPYLPNQIVIAGGGQWPGETAEALVYDVASDTYDYTFPNLINARRDHGGAFVPLVSENPADGLPGMWVFGGRQGSDVPPYMPAEFFPLAAGEPEPDIEVSVESLEATQYPDTISTQDFEICNVGDALLEWEIFETESMMLVDETVIVSAPAVEARPGLASRSGSAGRPAVEFEMNLGWISVDTIDVLLVTPDVVGGGDINLLLNTLAAFPDLNVTLWDGNAGTPSVADMQNYHLVFVGNDILWTSSAINKITLSNNLADYIDAGGKVIAGSFVWSYDDWGFGGGRFITEDYSPYEIATTDFWNPATLGAYDPDHPIMDGITNVTDGVNHQDPALTPNGSWIASWNDGENFVAESPGSVGLNQLYFHTAIFGGQVGELLHNAILYLAYSEPVDVPWLSEDPTSGVVAPGECQVVEVTFDSTGMEVGEYSAGLLIASNDPDEPEIAIPVTLTVVEPLPDIVVDPLALEMTLGEDETADAVVNISNVGDGDLHITAIDGLPAWLSTDFVETTLLSGEDIDVTFTFDSTGLAEGDYTADLLVQSNDPDEPEITISAALTVFIPEPDIVVDPLALDMDLGEDETADAVVNISNVGDGDLTISAIDGLPAWLMTDFEETVLLPGEDIDVTFTFDSTGLGSGTYTATIAVHSDDPDDPVVQIEVTLTVTIVIPVPEDYYLFLPLVTMAP